MRKVGRNRLFMSIVLSAILIVLMILFMIMNDRNSAVIFTMFSIIVVLSLVAVAANYYGLKQVDKRVEALPKEYKLAFTDAKESIGLSAMSREMKMTAENAILEIFEHAALDKRHLQDVIQPDFETFVSAFIEEGNGQYSFKYLFSVSMVMFISYMYFMKLYKVLKVNLTFESFRLETLDIGIVVSYALIAFIFLPWMMIVMKAGAMKQWQGPKRLLITLPFIIPVALLVLLIGFDSEGLRQILDQPVPMLNSLYKFIASLILLVGGLIVMRQNK